MSLKQKNLKYWWDPAVSIRGHDGAAASYKQRREMTGEHCPQVEPTDCSDFCHLSVLLHPGNSPIWETPPTSEQKLRGPGTPFPISWQLEWETGAVALALWTLLPGTSHLETVVPRGGDGIPGCWWGCWCPGSSCFCLFSGAGSPISHPSSEPQYSFSKSVFGFIVGLPWLVSKHLACCTRRRMKSLPKSWHSCFCWAAVLFTPISP